MWGMTELLLYLRLLVMEDIDSISNLLAKVCKIILLFALFA
jgi:hypothetical protein